ncbi:hypothetical protein BIW11_07705 [Tropilaelaps mercedesae]|uniref:Uncharacterized protein n=1 Tax=Tropilaelaps mercedesae TaxID=418985 RepID=A0A1V9XSU1_9ACAR|nr:hypothetical protein BIW11_07705 [Tropilaelaps mercedesae]
MRFALNPRRWWRPHLPFGEAAVPDLFGGWGWTGGVSGWGGRSENGRYNEEFTENRDPVGTGVRVHSVSVRRPRGASQELVRSRVGPLELAPSSWPPRGPHVSRPRVGHKQTVRQGHRMAPAKRREQKVKTSLFGQPQSAP